MTNAIQFINFNTEVYTGTNPQIKALEEVIKNAPSRDETIEGENPIMDESTTNKTYSKQRIHCVVEETVQDSL